MNFKPLLLTGILAALAACAHTDSKEPVSVQTHAATAASEASAADSSKVSRQKIGAYDFIALNLDILSMDPSWFDGKPLSTAQINEIANRNHAPRMADGSLQGALNAYLLRSDKQLIVIDAGKADGKVFAEHLQQAGYRPEQVNAVLLTHTHPDHTGGLLTEGKATFPNATLYLSQAESKLDSAAAVMAAYQGRVKTFAAGETVFDGIKSVNLAGHTAGHSGYEITSQGQSLLVWGDIVHNAYIQFDHPEATLKYDADENAARKTRQMIFAQTAKNHTVVAGMHLPFPGIGQVEAAGKDKYRWVAK